MSAIKHFLLQLPYKKYSNMSVVIMADKSSNFSCSDGVRSCNCSCANNQKIKTNGSSQTVRSLETANKALRESVVTANCAISLYETGAKCSESVSSYDLVAV